MIYKEGGMMKIKISPTVLSISPYISTTWKNVSSLQMGQDGRLNISLSDGKAVAVPDLDPQSVDAIFEAHTRYGGQEKLPIITNVPDSPYTFSLPFGTDGNPLASMSHNPEQAHLAPLPPEVLQRIVAIGRALGLKELPLNEMEPHCNCFYCQVARAMQLQPDGALLEPIETLDAPLVDDEELSFKTWDVEQKADKLYTVANPLDKEEHYNVYLGDPLGCTCGHKNCEHIRAVLST
jgi:hypothetical protein